MKTKFKSKLLGVLLVLVMVLAFVPVSALTAFAAGGTGNVDFAIKESFKVILAKNGLKKIRLHDLRHSCASLLLANKVPMKMMQDWLGHSDMSTTANIYSHVDHTSKLESAKVIGNLLGA